MRQPVMAYVLEKLYTDTTRSGEIEAGLTKVPSKLISS